MVSPSYGMKPCLGGKKGRNKKEKKREKEREKEKRKTKTTKKASSIILNMSIALRRDEPSQFVRIKLHTHFREQSGNT